ncbi:hypothetical protein SNE25_28490 [Mucilaginibacter sabulilitoris]|uniref:Lipocalin-like domain-containing protein n=1 Tax=Mucilaginibacter sabulilitoris TaxID=1173583 RepID=A0ABZ0TKC4_9SPHI|nr:hypothetical protein [Mucilaginibacter sabulilitoris]WPU93264.1 hypothetical protein SNE25_28490 [Mucilaginibacter sabulilitoris]
MKHFILILFAAVAIQISACKKDNKTKADTTLTGKWKLVRNKISSGGPMYWVKATNVSYALFNTDGTLDGTAFNDFKFYTLKDSVTLTLNKADKTEYEDYRYNIKGDSLTMSPLGPVICIEGCAMQFIKE